MQPDYVQDNDVAVGLIASLLVYEAAEVLSIAERRRALGQVPEEALIRLVETLKYFLHRLAVKKPTADTLGKMRLHPRTGNVAPGQTVVPLLQRKGVVPYETALTKHHINLAITPALIECVFVGHHST